MDGREAPKTLGTTDAPDARSDAAPAACFSVNGADASAPEGQNLLDALLSLGLPVAHLCHRGGSPHPGSACRLCFVEVAGYPSPMCACELAVREGMSVATGTPRCRQLAARALRLLAAEHKAACKDCPKRMACPFREMAAQLGIPLSELLNTDGEHEPRKQQTQGIAIDQGKCVLCRRCRAICDEVGHSFIGLAGRGPDTRVAIDVGAYADIGICKDCLSCIDACPVGAIGFDAN